MKKKCRIYGTGGAYSYKMQAGGQKPSMTQDSDTEDHIPEQKTASFVDWLQTTSTIATFKNQLKEEKARLKGMAKYGLEKAQQGQFIPGNEVYDPEYYANLSYGMPGDYANAPQANVSGDYSFPDAMPTKMEMRTIEQIDNTSGPKDILTPTAGLISNAGKEGKGWLNAHYGMQGGLAALNLAANIANSAEKRRQEIQLKKRMTDPHNIFATNQAVDRGDYMVNVPGVGDPLKPHQHTRMGYNTKVAQDGMEVGAEMDLTEEEINRLIAEGYDLEYLD